VRVLRWFSLFVAVLLVAGALAAYAKYRSVWDSISRVTLSGLGHRPPKYTSALNVLVFGYDERKALTRHQQVAWHVGHVAENSTDTIMLAHISPGRRGVTVLSIPRDTMVPVYKCNAGRAPDGTTFAGQAAAPGAVEQINAIYNIGGPSCLVKTIEQQTGIRIDHFIGLGLAGFVKVINDIGGVYVCMPVAVNDTVSGLVLPRGWHKIFGATALKFWRTRENLGTGSDLQRIQRDQYFMASLLHGITHNGLLSNPAKMLSVVSDIAQSMTTDSAMTAQDMVHIAASLRGVGSGHVQFITAPNGADPADINKVVFAQPQADRVFTAIAHDRTLPKAVKKTGKNARGNPPALLTTPSKVKVAVLNGSGVAGQAAKAGTSLTSRGFDVVSEGDAARYNYTTSVIEYARPAELAAVNTLKAEFSHITVQQNASLTRGTIELITGSSYSGLNPALAASNLASSQHSISGLSGKYGGITGSARMCSSSGLATFTGAGTVNG
jgi:LCP family protein required for cell wall assembly